VRIVISARPYLEHIGGHVVLHKLCDSLVRQGLPAFLRPDKSRWAINPNYLSPVTDHVAPDDVVIYHDSIQGNPWRARRVIRWMLYLPRDPIDGLPLYFSPAFGPGPYLRVIEPHLDLFRDRGLPRAGTCWTWRKAEIQGWSEADRPRSGTEIRRGTSNQKLADLFNRHKRFVCYDGATFLAKQAALCGCDVIVPRPLGGLRSTGIAVNEDGLPQARAERAQLRADLEAEYRTQDAEAARVVRWAIAAMGGA
jgi:hypothetical protein